MAGRPKPNWQKQLTGSRHYNPRAPQPGPPADLSVPRGLLTPAGRKFWHDNLPGLVDQGVVTEADMPAFLLLAQSWQFAQEAARLVRKGLLIPDKKGSVKKSPAWQQWRDASQLFLKIAGSFGMLPDMRSRLDVAPVDSEEDELVRLLFQKAAQGD